MILYTKPGPECLKLHAWRKKWEVRMSLVSCLWVGHSLLSSGLKVMLMGLSLLLVSVQRVEGLLEMHQDSGLGAL